MMAVRIKPIETDLVLIASLLFSIYYIAEIGVIILRKLREAL